MLPTPNTKDVGLRPFPIPQASQQASQEELALQGLDPALVDAEIVNSTTTIPVDALSDDVLKNQPGAISSRMRKRLQDLGITEYFAGNKIFFRFKVHYH